MGLSIPNYRLYSTALTIDYGGLIATAVFQVLLALLTGGRIWWISREVRRLMGRSANARYNSTIAIIIESGLLYAAFLVLSVVLGLAVDPDRYSLIPFDVGPIVFLMSIILGPRSYSYHRTSRVRKVSRQCPTNGVVTV
ncbi:hypothetical protein L218DRAFT_967442, partial [Marasmius fiardii PR-910]